MQRCTSGGKEVFQKKPFGRRWYLISSSVRDCEFSTTTSGTERECGFVGRLPFRSDPLVKVFSLLFVFLFFLFESIG